MSSPVRPASPENPGGLETTTTPENHIGPDSIRVMCDSIGTFLSEDASRELAEHAT